MGAALVPSPSPPPLLRPSAAAKRLALLAVPPAEARCCVPLPSPLVPCLAALPESAHPILRKFKCGETALGLVDPKGGYSPQLAVCVRIAAAFQITKDDPKRRAALASIDFAARDLSKVGDEFVLAGFDLLLNIFTEHLKKLPEAGRCYDAKQAAPALAHLNTAIRTALEAATAKLKGEAEAYLDSIGAPNDKEESEL